MSEVWLPADQRAKRRISNFKEKVLPHAQNDSYRYNVKSITTFLSVLRVI